MNVRSSPMEGGSLTRDSLRQGDHGFGIPQPRAEGAQVLSEEENAKDQRQRDERRQLEKKRLRQRDTAGDLLQLPASILRVATWIGLTVASVLGLLLVGQGAALIGDIKTLPTPFGWIAGVSAALFAAMLGWLILRLGVALFRLHLRPATRLPGRLQHPMSRHFQRKLQRELKTYLNEYRVDDDALTRLGELGLSEENRRKLKDARRSLLNNTVRIPAGDWLSKYQRNFQLILDDTAKRRINHYAFKVAAGTAVARVAVIDQAIVLYSSVALVKDLMFIYGLRPEFSQVVMILASSIRNTYLAGPMQEVSEEGIIALFKEIFPDLPVNKLGEKMGAIVMEAFLNRALILRLGQQTIQLLQPVHPTEPS